MAAAIAVCATVLIIVGLSLPSLIHKPFAFQTLVRDQTVRKCNRDVSPDVASGRKFAENFIRGYRQALDEKVPFPSQAQLEFSSATNVSARLLLSCDSECFLFLHPDTNSQLVVSATEFPAQAVAQLGWLPWLHNKGHCVEPLAADNPFIKGYTTFPATAGFRSGSIILEGEGTFSLLANQRPFLVYDDFVLGLRNITIETQLPTGVVSVVFSEFTLLTGGLNFKKVLPLAEGLGKTLATSQISDLWFKSELFRKALADKQLSPLAETILAKHSRAKKDPNFKYLEWQQEKDIQDLKKQLRDSAVSE